MSHSQSRCPLNRSQAIDLYFMEHRAKLIDIAAFLDRFDRATDDSGGADDFRMAALRKAIGILTDGRPQRARRVLEFFSDPTTEPIQAAGMKGALGAYDAPPPRGRGVCR
jgi:hypothetical protein